MKVKEKIVKLKIYKNIDYFRKNTTFKKAKNERIKYNKNTKKKNQT